MPDYVSSNKRIDDLTLDDLGNALNMIEANTFKELVKTGLFQSTSNCIRINQKC
ncbi:MAG: hypothetical protein IPL16_01600 [Ignavibacteria bacterium]|nr:hypothetical protein [Ignavibacteria bacterium]